MKEENETKLVIEEGRSQLIKSEDTIYSLIENTDNTKTKIFVNVNYPEKTLENEFASLYTDSECKTLFQELKPSKGFNNVYNFDISVGQKLFLKSNHTNKIFFYYKYCTEKDLEQMKSLKLKSLKVKCLENKDNTLKITFNCPYTEEVKFSTKYTIYVTEEKNKKYKIFKDENIKEAKIIEGTKEKYEIEVKIDSSKKDQFVYIVAEPKDPSVHLRPRIIYKGEFIPEAYNKTDTIINGILIVLIIITFIYKFMKKRRLAQQRAQSNASGNDTLI